MQIKTFIGPASSNSVEERANKFMSDKHITIKDVKVNYFTSNIHVSQPMVSYTVLYEENYKL